MDNLLVAEKLLRVVDLLKSDLEKVQLENDYDQAILEHRIVKLEECKKDHELRIRSMQSGVVNFKTWSGLSSVCAVIISILALIRSVLGG